MGAVPDRHVSKSVLRRALAIAGAAEVELVGSSMSPLIRSGARARVIRCEPRDVRRFDVVVFEREGRHVAHLVSAIDEHGFVTSALGAPHEGPPIREEELLGRLEGIVIRRLHLRRLPRDVCRSIVGVIHTAIRFARH